jgi:hypothetical protein
LKNIKRILLSLILASSLYGQSAQIQGSQSWRITGYVLTTSPVSLSTLVTSGSLTALPPAASATVWLCGGDINASAGTAATVSIKDGNGAYYWNAIAPLSATVASNFNFPFGTVPANGAAYGGCRPFPAGLLVSASAGSTITFSAWGVY